MATMTVSLPEPMKGWVEDQVLSGDYASSSDYVRDLIRRDRERRDRELSLEEIRALVADSKASGVGAKSVGDIFAEAKRILRTAGGR